MKIDEETLEEFIAVEHQLAEFEAEIKKLRQKEEVLKSKIIGVFMESHESDYCDERIKIKFVPSTTRLVIDSKRLKDEFPEAANKCSKFSVVKEGIRVKLLDVDGEDK